MKKIEKREKKRWINYNLSKISDSTFGKGFWGWEVYPLVITIWAKLKTEQDKGDIEAQTYIGIMR